MRTANLQAAQINLSKLQDQLSSGQRLTVMSDDPSAASRTLALQRILAAKDQFGFFAAGAIRGPLEIIAGRRIEIPQFARHLSEFLRDDRGAPLRRQGVKHRYLYRFRDPILQTYVVLDGLASGLLAEERLSQMEGWQAPPQPDLGTLPEPLF